MAAVQWTHASSIRRVHTTTVSAREGDPRSLEFDLVVLGVVLVLPCPHYGLPLGVREEVLLRALVCETVQAHEVLAAAKELARGTQKVHLRGALRGRRPERRDGPKWHLGGALGSCGPERRGRAKVDLGGALRRWRPAGRFRPECGQRVRRLKSTAVSAREGDPQNRPRDVVESESVWQPGVLVGKPYWDDEGFDESAHHKEDVAPQVGVHAQDLPTMQLMVFLQAGPLEASRGPWTGAMDRADGPGRWTGPTAGRRAAMDRADGGPVSVAPRAAKRRLAR